MLRGKRTVARSAKGRNNFFKIPNSFRTVKFFASNQALQGSDDASEEFIYSKFCASGINQLINVKGNGFLLTMKPSMIFNDGSILDNRPEMLNPRCNTISVICPIIMRDPNKET